MTLSPRSLARLDGVHPDLQRVVIACAAAGARFQVTEGCRTAERQQTLFAAGKSKTLKSRHLTGHAVDLVAVHEDGTVTYDEPDMKALAKAMKAAAASIGIPIEWGGDWKSFQDTPHFQLPISAYPAEVGPTITMRAREIPTPEPQNGPPGASEPPPHPMPPPSAPAPGAQISGWAAVRQAMGRSKTIFGAIVTAIGALLQYLDSAFKVLLDGLSEAASYAPVQSLLATAGHNTKAIGFGLGAFGVVMVITRRLQAAHGGTPG